MKRNLEPYDNIVEVVGWTPLVRLRRIGRGIRTPALRQGREPEPGRVGEGPHRPLDHRGRRAAGRAEAGRRDRRGHERQHRHRPRDRRRDQGLPLHLHDPRQDVEREDPAPPRLRGRGRSSCPTAVPPDHPEYYIQKAKAIVAQTPGAIFANQHYNPDNPEAHYRTTGPEIWEQTKGKITHFVCSPGTGGTVTGRRPVPEGEEPRGEGDRGRPGGLDLHRVRALPREGAGRAVQGGGHRRGQDPDLARLRRWWTSG